MKILLELLRDWLRELKESWVEGKPGTAKIAVLITALFLALIGVAAVILNCACDR